MSVRGLIVVLVLILVGWGIIEAHGTLQAHALRERLLDANIQEVPTIVQDMVPYRRRLRSLLQEAAAQAAAKKDSRKQLHVSLALLPVDEAQVDYLLGRLLDGEPDEVPVIRRSLAPHKDQLLDRLWSTVEQPARGKERQRLRAASALAAYEPDSLRWTKLRGPVVEDLVSVNPVFLGLWSDSLRPVKGMLIEPLSAIFRDHKPERGAERTLATNLLADYASGAAENPGRSASWTPMRNSSPCSFRSSRITESRGSPV